MDTDYGLTELAAVNGERVMADTYIKKIRGYICG